MSVSLLPEVSAVVLDPAIVALAKCQVETFHMRDQKARPALEEKRWKTGAILEQTWGRRLESPTIQLSFLALRDHTPCLSWESKVAQFAFL